MRTGRTGQLQHFAITLSTLLHLQPTFLPLQGTYLIKDSSLSLQIHSKAYPFFCISLLFLLLSLALSFLPLYS
ncbi:hypothetical protein J3R30DRAFT_3484523 [Lentinula aciculospora]|uniref:Uncharacterized protein n=1 Tax=Lentinula aciculospora TaxID=153920 RepID=A0A9W9DM64_9AGAR|nr:hypothetical protein J3R30DRAFT_3484523 [Lentinula aciculospora]